MVDVKEPKAEEVLREAPPQAPPAQAPPQAPTALEPLSPRLLKPLAPRPLEQRRSAKAMLDDIKKRFPKTLSFLAK
jgi:hypothetical protein